ncbi:MAG: NAD(P)/FAD-dependent oxidoreductase [Candidatus Kapaibacterium sp.]
MIDVIVLGGGAAGLMCALTAAQRGRRVLVLERSERIGKKILISGGGRCNFTNREVRSENYLSENPHFCKSALARYTPLDFIGMVEKHGIAYHEKKLGQLFCDGSAREIVAMFERELGEVGVRILCNTGDAQVRRTDDGWLVSAAGTEFHAASLVVATGGLSIPKMGATDFGLRLAREHGHRIVPPRPALVPLTFTERERGMFEQLSGVSMDAEVRCGTAVFRENILFTHKGVSGPAILQISSYWSGGQGVHLDLLCDPATADILERNVRSAKDMKNVLSLALPRRFAELWCDLHSLDRPAVQMNEKEHMALMAQLHDWEIHPSGTEGYAKAEVTAGGVDTRELSSKTMESARVSGLFFVGEVVDVTGWLGGYNFQWAWASGHAAGMHA